MTTSEPIGAALSIARDALVQLDVRCCEPGRSPRMAALAAKLEEIRRHAGEGADTDALVAIEEAGAMVGALQVSCCAPNRLPLYAQILAELTAAQLALSGAHLP